MEKLVLHTLRCSHTFTSNQDATYQVDKSVFCETSKGMHEITQNSLVGKPMTYHHVYFRIDTKLYAYVNGYMSFTSEENATLFYNIATALFINDGWELKEARSSNSCPTVTKGKQSLYLHPQSFSGIVATDNIENNRTITTPK